MDKHLAADLAKQEKILMKAAQDAAAFLEELNERPVQVSFPRKPAPALPEEGLGAEKVGELFKKEYLPYVPASTGPRFFGYVIGGVTPAALAGDWYASTIDQNAFGYPGTFDRRIEEEAIGMIRQLLGLPEAFGGVFVSGATTSAFVAMACARQWAAAKSGHSASQEGLYGLPRPQVASGLAHGANYKALSMAGMGRGINSLPLLAGREAVDIKALEDFLANRDQNIPLIYIANMGTAASGDLDNLNAVAALKEKYDFWLHVDGAFGGMMASVPEYRHLFAGLGAADSVTMDTHKWLNVPYDGAVILLKNRDYQFQAFTNSADARGGDSRDVPHYHLTPEGSRRLRALPVWFSLLAYGGQGYADICRRNVELCKYYGEKINASRYFRLLNQVRSNVAAFSLDLPEEQITPELIQEILGLVEEEGITYSNYVPYLGKPALRVCMTNWRTDKDDVDAAFASMERAAKKVLAGRQLE